MKTILYMAVSVNGMIAAENDDTSWVSEGEWEHYKKMVSKIGNLVVGRKTYDVMRGEGTFADLEENLLVVVVSKLAEEVSLNGLTQKFFIAHSPGEAIEILENAGFDEALVAGGGKLNASFMKEGLVDELIIDLEPKVLVNGISLFAQDEFVGDLELLEVRYLDEHGVPCGAPQGTVQFHYRVVAAKSNINPGRGR